MLKRTLGTLALALATTLLAVASAGAATITNGNFDDGLTGWNPQTSSIGYWQAEADCNGTGQCFRSNADGDSFGLIEQTVTLEANHTHRLTFSFKATGGAWMIPTQIQDGMGVVGQEARVDVMSSDSEPWSTTDAGVLATVFRTDPADATDYPWRDVSFDLTPWAGQTVILRFRWVMGQTYMDAAIDNVAITSTDLTPPVVEPPTADTTPPVINSLKLSTHRFESSARGTRLFASRARGSKLSFNLSEAASIAISLKKYSVAKDTWSPVSGSATLKGVAGPNSTTFTARLNRKKPLAPGKYMIVFRPTDAAGNVGVQSVRVIRVLRPR